MAARILSDWVLGWFMTYLLLLGISHEREQVMGKFSGQVLAGIVLLVIWPLCLYDIGTQLRALSTTMTRVMARCDKLYSKLLETRA